MDSKVDRRDSCGYLGVLQIERLFVCSPRCHASICSNLSKRERVRNIADRAFFKVFTLNKIQLQLVKRVTGSKGREFCGGLMTNLLDTGKIGCRAFSRRAGPIEA